MRTLQSIFISVLCLCWVATATSVAAAGDTLNTGNQAKPLDKKNRRPRPVRDQDWRM